MELRPGHPLTGVDGLVSRTAISVACPSGALGTQVTEERGLSSLVTADQGVTILTASVTPGLRSEGRNQRSTNRSSWLGAGPRTNFSNTSGV